MKSKVFGKGRKKWLTIATLLLTVILPATVVATVIIQYEIAGTVGVGTSPVVFNEDLNYATAHAMGFSTVTLGTNLTKATITLNPVAGAYATYLMDQLNVLQNIAFKYGQTWDVTFTLAGNISNAKILEAYAFIAQNATVTGLSTTPVNTTTDITIPYFNLTKQPVIIINLTSSSSNSYAKISSLTTGSYTTPTWTSPQQITFYTLGTYSPTNILHISFAFVLADGTASLTSGNTFMMLMTLNTAYK